VTDEVREKWRAASAGAHYASTRWRSQAKRERDPRRVAALLAEHLAVRPGAVLLDAPCGAGRLWPALERHGRYVGLDVSSSMLAAARAQSGHAAHGATFLAGDAARLPFRDDSFDAVVCCRLLHHLAERAAAARVVAELVRVSRGLVIASFWDAGSLPAWRRRLLPGARPPRRHARARTELAALFSEAGAEVLGFAHTLRFVTRQAFVVARKRRPE
jgi:SAM-dependent methyltransferase